MANPNLNYIEDLEDEIALEGLDGITIEGKHSCDPANDCVY